MIAGMVILEDSVLHFREVDGMMELSVGDNMTGVSKTEKVTFEQAGAIIGTSICGTNEAVMTACEPLVKAVMANWPRELQSSPCA